MMLRGWDYLPKALSKSELCLGKQIGDSALYDVSFDGRWKAAGDRRYIILEAVKWMIGLMVNLLSGWCWFVKQLIGGVTDKIDRLEAEFVGLFRILSKKRK